MKILHVCESIIGGTGSYLAELIPYQVAAYGRENIQMLVPDTQMEFTDPAIIEADPQTLTFRRPTRASGAFFLAASYLLALRRFRPDIVHVHSSIAGVVVRSVARRGRHRVVYCPHGWSVDRQGARYTGGIAGFLERRLGRVTDNIIVISPHEYKRAAELGVPTSKITLVESGIRREVPTVPAAEWTDPRIRVLYAGRFDHQKGVDLLLKAVEGLEDRLCVRLVGGFAVSDGRLPDELPSNVTQLGWLDREGVYAQMKASDVLVVPSRWEGFGLVAVEAMRMQVPVIAAAVGGLVQILGNGKYGLMVPPEDPQALHDCLARLTREDLRALGAAGRARFLASYTSDRMVREIDDVYASLLNAQPVAVLGT